MRSLTSLARPAVQHGIQAAGVLLGFGVGAFGLAGHGLRISLATLVVAFSMLLVGMVEEVFS